jgi:hypothetical protein
MTGPTDAEDLAAILSDDLQIDELRKDVESHRQAIVDRHGLDGIGPVMLALARISGLAAQMSGVTEQMAIEVRLIRHYFGEA